MTTAKKSTKKTWSAVDDGDDDKPRSHGGMCAAHGCPMIGSVSPHSAGGGWVCYSHIAVTSANWQEVTKRLNQAPEHVDIVTALRKALNGQAVELRQIIQRIEQTGQIELLPMAGENTRAWHKRVNKSLIDMATRGLQEIVVTESGVPARTGDEIMGSVLEFMRKRGIEPRGGETV